MRSSTEIELVAELERCEDLNSADRIVELINKLIREKIGEGCSDCIAALEDAGVEMGDFEQPQDPITAIGILGDRAKKQKRENMDDLKRRIYDLEMKVFGYTNGPRDLKKDEYLCSKCRRVIAAEESLWVDGDETICEACHEQA